MLNAGAVRGAIHGTIVAESVIDIAPEVTLYIANPQSKGDLRDAADWMVSEGVSVINHSVGWLFDGPGDGTSPLSSSPLRTVDRAVASDMIWVNAAGNDAQKTGSEATRTLTAMGQSGLAARMTKLGQSGLAARMTKLSIFSLESVRDIESSCGGKTTGVGRVQI